MKYSLPFEKIATSGSADTDKTIAALIAADTAGVRARVTALHVVAADATPQDNQVYVRLERVNDVSAGSAGTPDSSVSAANMPKKDPNSATSPISGGLNYTGEPSAYQANPPFEGGFNARGRLDHYWPNADGPEIHPDMILGLVAGQRGGNAVLLSGTIEFETF